MRDVKQMLMIGDVLLHDIDCLLVNLPQEVHEIGLLLIATQTAVLSTFDIEIRALEDISPRSDWFHELAKFPLLLHLSI